MYTAVEKMEERQVRVSTVSTVAVGRLSSVYLARVRARVRVRVRVRAREHGGRGQVEQRVPG